MSRFAKLVRAAGCVAVTAVGAAPALAQFPTPVPGVSRVVPETTAPTSDVFTASGHRRVAPPGYYTVPGTDCPPVTVPGTTMPGMTPQPAPQPAPQTPVPGAPDLFSGADAGPTAGLGGYIDNALPMNVFRLRYDSNYGNNRPDRGEFFYAKCGCFNTPDARGPRLPETNVDSQTLSAYAEYAIDPRLSVFADIPVRFLNPQANNNAAGFSDIRFGAKYAFLYSATRVVSFQTQVIIPTGQAVLGLGTGNTWLEPALLYQESLTDRWQVFGQVKDQFALDRQSDFTGNILTYGLGTSYQVAKGCWGYVAPVGEVVGWSVLSGRELNPDAGADVSARGATIVNAKVGVRFGLGEPAEGYASRSDLYLGYGRALTGEVWYKDMFRVEYRLFY